MKYLITLALLLGSASAFADVCSDFDNSNRDQYAIGKWENLLRNKSTMALIAFYQEKSAFLQQCPTLSDFSRVHLQNAMKAAESLMDRKKQHK